MPILGYCAKCSSTADQKRLDPEEADRVFTLLDIYISDNFSSRYPDKDLCSGDFFELLMEGMHLHHFGDQAKLGQIWEK